MAVGGRLKFDTLLAHFVTRGEAPYLEAPGIGQDRFLPVHKAMQPSMPADDLRPGTQHQVEGIAEYDLGTEAFEVLGGQRLDGTVRTHRHKRRRFNRAARKTQLPASCGPVSRMDGKMIATHCVSSGDRRSRNIASP